MAEPYSRPPEPKKDGFGDVEEPASAAAAAAAAGGGAGRRRSRAATPGGAKLKPPHHLAPLAGAATAQAPAGGGAAAADATHYGLSVEWLLDWAAANGIGGDGQWYLDSPTGKALQGAVAAGLKGGCSPHCAARSVASTLRNRGEEPPYEAHVARVIAEATALRKTDPAVDQPLPAALTTADVLAQRLAPATAATGRSYVETFVLRAQAAAAVTAPGGGSCSDPTHVVRAFPCGPTAKGAAFLCCSLPFVVVHPMQVVHSHRLRFWDLVQALAAHQLGGAAALAARRRPAAELRAMLRRHFLAGNPTHFYWLDVFCNPQPAPAARRHGQKRGQRGGRVRQRSCF
eukprot:SAG22_NODE_799_length_7128_cov_14.224356_8_plen_344_part_00